MTARARDRYLRPFAERRRKIVSLARSKGNAEASKVYGISRQRVSELVIEEDAKRARAARVKAKATTKMTREPSE